MGKRVRRKLNAEKQISMRKKQRPVFSPSELKRFAIVPRSLRSVAGAPRTARKEMPATPVGMTE